ELLLDALEGGDPRARQVRVVVRTEKALGADEERGVVLVPADALPAPEGRRDLRLVLEERGQDLEAALGEDGALLVGEHHRLLVVQAEPARGGIIIHVTAGS